MTDVVFLSDLSQLGVVEKMMLRQLPDLHVVTSSLTVGAELERLGIPFSDGLSYLEPEEIAHNLRLAYQLTDGWWNEQLGDVEFLGFSLAHIARQELAMPFELCLNAKIAYQRLFASKSVCHIYGFFLPPVAVCRTGPAPAFRPAASVTQAVLLWLAQREGIPVTGLRTYRPLKAEGRQWKPRLTSEDLKKNITNSSFPPSRCPANKPERVVILWRMGLWADEISELERGFASVPGWRLVELSERELTLGMAEHQKDIYDQIDQKLNRAQEAHRSSFNHYTGRYPEIFANSYLRFQFERIFAEMRKAVRLGLSFASLLDILQPSLIIFGHEAFAIERALVQIARCNKIPTVGLLHGGLQPKYGRLGVVGDADHIMVWGPNDVRELKWAGIGEERLNQVGSLRFDRLYRFATTGSKNDNIQSHKIQIKQRLRLSIHHPVILLLTAPTNVELSQPAADPAGHRKTWYELVALANRRSDLTFVIKPHPAYDFIDFYRYLCDHGPRNLILLKPLNLEVAVQASDVAVLINYCSTAAMEAMLLNVPVVFVRTAIYTTEMHKDIFGERATKQVSSIAELEVTIDRLLSDGTFGCENILDSQQLLQSLLGERGQTALERMMAKLEEIAIPQINIPPNPKPDLENNATQRFAEKMKHLYESGNENRFLSDLPSLVSYIREKMEHKTDLLERVMFGLAFTIGYTASGAEELSNMMQICSAEFSSRFGVSIGVRNKMVLRAYLVAIARHLDAGWVNTARILAWYALMEIPDEAVHFRLYLELLAKSLIGGNRFALFLVNVSDWIRATYAKFSLPHYVHIKM